MELTNIEVLVFEDDDGNEIEMQIVDEFGFEGEAFIALVPADSKDGEEIQVCKVLPEDEYEQVEDGVKLSKLLDIIEERVMNRF